MKALAFEIYMRAGGWTLGDGGFPVRAKIDTDLVNPRKAKGTWYESMIAILEPTVFFFRVGPDVAIYKMCGFSSDGVMIADLLAKKHHNGATLIIADDAAMQDKCKVWLNERENQDAKGGLSARDESAKIHESGGGDA